MSAPSFLMSVTLVSIFPNPPKVADVLEITDVYTHDTLDDLM